MAEPFTSKIRLMSFNFAPKGRALCNGPLLPINQNQALFALLGTTDGDNGQTNFALSDLLYPREARADAATQHLRQRTGFQSNQVGRARRRSRQNFPTIVLARVRLAAVMDDVRII